MSKLTSMHESAAHARQEGDYRPLVRFVALLSILAACDGRDGIEARELARFPTGSVVEVVHSARERTHPGLPELLDAHRPVIGRGVCVPEVKARPDGAHNAPRFGVWTFEYVRAEESTTPDGQLHTRFGDLRTTSLGLEARGEYSSNRPHGTWRFWHPNGNVRAEGSAVEGVMTGTWTFWHEDGSRDESLSGSYVDGVRMSAASQSK